MTKTDICHNSPKGVLGIDLGTNKAATCFITNLTDGAKTNLIDVSKLDTTNDRFIAAIVAIKKAIRKYNPELVVIEYPFNAPGNGAILLEMFGVIHFYVAYNMIKYIALPQTVIKKYATGDGKAEKSDMRMRLYKEYRLDFSEDVTDAFWIAHFGYSYLHGPNTTFRKETIERFMVPKVKKSRKKKNK